MKNTPLVSIVLCTYNGEKFISQLLETLVRQTYPDIEIIAVDDCSADSTYAILSGYASNYPQIRIYRNEENLGFVGNFQHALTYCKGELIAFCDQDDLWDQRKITLQVAAMGDNLLIYHDSEFIDEKNEPLNKKMSDMFNFYRGSDPLAFLFFNCVSGHAMLIKRQLLDDALPLKEGFFHDWWLAYAAVNTGSIDFIPECLVKYRQHDKSQTDLLKIKDAARDSQRNMSAAAIYKMRTARLRLFAGFDKNKNPEFVKTLYQLYKNRANEYLSVQLAELIEKNIGILHYMEKKPMAKKRREARKLIWGFKLKNIWYKYVKPNANKIVSPD